MGFDALVAEFGRAFAVPLPVVAVRLAGAILLCGLIGFEREATDHDAGLRTNILLGLAAASFALITLQLVADFEDRTDVVRMDPIRLVEAATSGVAFLAAGMIFLRRGEVRNLTTGAMMWLSAGIGLACGLGLWPLAVLTALFALAVARLLHWLRRRVRRG